ncbi:MAG TPA: M12 family metallo-peptidase [Candidatus Thiothrix moscowensis]|uniref:reprolysin-like metallopeptidase n=1 Tax=unclassified Thiothrix TaxID=2636184 RepID=UPI0025D82F67|nr:MULTISPECIES: M12 family metallo-peptidase [unclassified Thiothrix]HRJ51309.1 M12 family metallo-peptidase [Candidatus Thiothrix moscowensis]HRJ91636.1 M12 family metallo-peptidase [Candidatus Thiothrix moscowensis]
MRIATIVLLLLANTTAGANTFIWQDQGMIQNDSAVSARSSGADVSPLQQYRRLTLDEAALRTNLNASTQARSSQGMQASIQLPLPDGGFADVVLTSSATLAPAVATAHPEIQTWEVSSTNGSILGGAVSLTPLGFHAMLDMANGDTVFIDPQNQQSKREYASFSKRDNAAAFRRNWSCQTHDALNFRPDLTNATRTAARAGETLHTYDLAIATTAEFTAWKGSQANALASVTATVARLNVIYSRDLSIALRLVSGTNTLFTDTNTDGYTHGDASSLIDQNTIRLDSILGNATYDVGHVFDKSDFGDGRAYVGKVCNDTLKGGGVSGFNTSGDAFDIDYVAHELGHQFGATHTFNGISGSCTTNREAATAYEPGSGSTIMAYAGICGSDDLQANSDAMFHAASIAQITTFAHSGTGASCAAASALTNSNPVVNAGADFTVTIGQAITLNGSATDADGDTLSYSWEQMDAGSASAPGVDTGNNALIRAHLPTNDPTRTITTSLPTTNRTLNFRLVARDQQGGVGFDDVRVTVSGTSSGGGGSSGGGDGSSGGGGGGSIPLAGLLAGGAYWLVRRRKGVKA